MKMNSSLLAAAGFLASLAMVSAADITGKITVKGTPPAEASGSLDPMCAKAHGSDSIKTRHWVVKDGGLADVFVYLKEGVTSKGSAPSEPAVLDQKGCEYIPYVLGAQTGQKIVVKNSDPLLHNVHPTPAVQGNQEYNKAQIGGAPPLEFKWDKPEVFLRFKCDVHPWMFAYVGLLDHPYYAVSGAGGTFKIANVPAGKYVVEAYHRKGGKVTQNVEVGADGKVVNFEITVPQ
jgi:hypothetical protein